MAHRRSTFDPQSNDNALLVGVKLPRSNGCSIRDKISLWEGKEPTHSSLTSDNVGQSSGVKRTDSLPKSNNKCIEDKQSAESCTKVAHKEKQDLRKENVGKIGDSRPCSPVEPTKQQRGAFNISKPGSNQRKLFEYFLVVSLQKSKAGAHYLPEVTQQFPPKVLESWLIFTEDQLRIIPQFCFPDAKDWEPVERYPSEMFSFVLTGVDGSRRFGYCRRLLPSGKGKRLPEVYCIVSHLGCFNLFSKVLDEVERRRALSPALVQPFMRAIMEAQFPAPGKTITIKTFLPGSGTEVMELCRPSDSRLEHVDFECLFSCLSLRLLLRVFGSLLLERRVIFTADKLSTLSQCCHAVVALLYPFVWQHTYIPVLPSAMLDIVCTPTPFIVGLLSSSLPQLTELPLEEVRGVIQVAYGTSYRSLPPALEKRFDFVMFYITTSNIPSPDSGHLSTIVSEAFVRFFVELVGHYPLFITGEREDGYSSSSSSPASSFFQREGFRKAIPSKTVRRFLEIFMETQMFGWFIQERELHRQALRGTEAQQRFLPVERENNTTKKALKPGKS
uniref:UDENN domain-containing protein n=1 Tax=Neolamprologus brichardi TaxID=32507 RepID=A0A3Q4I2V0_NEOBR